MEQVFLALLRQAIGWEQTESPAANPLTEQDWTDLLHLAQAQGVAPLIYNEALTGCLGDIPANIKTYIKQVCLATMLAQTKQLQVLQRTFAALEQKGLQPVLLKGFSLAQLYPKPYLRQWGDLDVYVGPDQYHPAAAALREAFPDAKHHDEEWEELKHYCYVLPDGNVVEMHRHTIAFESRADERYFYPLEQQAMQQALLLPDCRIQVEGQSILIPEPKFNMLFVFMHAWEHFYESGAAFKQLADVALLARSLQATPGMADYLAQHLPKLHLLQAWQIVGYFLIKTLHLNPSEWWLYAENEQIRTLGERFYHKVMDEGLYRHVRQEGEPDRYQAREQAKQMNVIARKILTLKTRINNAKPMFDIAPEYARHQLAASIKKGIIRTLKGSKMIDY